MKTLRAATAFVFAFVGTCLCIIGIIVDALERACAHVVKRLTEP